MIPASNTALPPPRVVAAGARRCARHGEREAVARCPACGGAFCRECVVEHGGRVLCANCIAREAALALAAAQPKRHWGQAIGRGTALAAGTLALWMLFYGLGSMLLKIPPNFHDGTVWSDAARKLTNPDEP